MLDTCIIIPCYNEYNRISKNEFLTFLDANHRYYFLFIDDGSMDNTFSLLEELCSRNERSSCYRLDENQGKAEAVRYGIQKAKEINTFDYYGYFDADLAIPIEELNKLYIQLNESDKIEFCYSSKNATLSNEVSQTFKRFIVGRILAKMVKLSLKINVYDTQCGCKMMTKKVAEVAFKNKFISAWLFDIEIFWRIIIAFGNEFIVVNTKEIPLMKLYNKGSSNVRIYDLIKLPMEFYSIHRFYKKELIK